MQETYIVQKTRYSHPENNLTYIPNSLAVNIPARHIAILFKGENFYSLTKSSLQRYAMFDSQQVKDEPERVQEFQVPRKVIDDLLSGKVTTSTELEKHLQ